MEVALNRTKLMMITSGRYFCLMRSTTYVPGDVSVLYVQQYIHALGEEYLLLHRPDRHDFQSHMVPSTSDGARPNVNFKKNMLILTNITN